MCGRFTLKTPEGIKFDHIAQYDPETWIPRYNIAPSQDILTVADRGPGSGSGKGSGWEAGFMTWGLIPSWSKEAKGIINARVETVDEKPSFNDSFRNRRCLILADGFYEWERFGKISQPYYFQMEDSRLFAFAGIWDQWRHNGRTITSCAILTTTANELLATIHHRMPVILNPESYALWLDENSRATDLKDLLVPFPAVQMKSHAVSYDVNDVKVDHEGLLRPVTPNIGVNLRLF